MAATGTHISPYVGLRHYGVDDAPRFFGRSSEAWQLTSLLFASRLVVVYGPSGVGKTSLLHAGVLAGLSRDAAQVLPVGRPASSASLPRAATEFNPFTFRLLSSWAPEQPEAAVRDLSIREFLESLPVDVDRYGEELPLVAVIDEFEEVFTDVPLWEGHRDDFLQQLGEAVEAIDRLRLMVSLKEDVVGEILPYESTLSRSNRTRFRLQPLDREAALEAVIGPLRPTRRTFAPGVAEALVDRLMITTITNKLGERRTVRTNTVEPISLQVVCSELWNGLPEDVSVITTDHLQDYADVEATLTDFCVQVVGEVAQQQRVPEMQVWEWLEVSFITDLGTRSNAYEGVDTTAGMPNSVARAFEERRILRSERRSGSVWFELLHDGLIEPIRAGRRRATQVGVETSPTPSDAYLSMAESALAYGMSQLAEELASQAARTSEDDPRLLAEAMSLLGKLVVSRGRAEEGDAADELFDAAENHYRQAASLFETEQNVRAVSQVLASLGRLYRERGRFADALGALQGAVSRTRGDVDLRLDLARALYDAGQPHIALSEYESLMNVAPVDALLGRASINAAQGNPATAIEDLDRAVDLQPDIAEREDVVALRERALARMESHEVHESHT